MRIAYCIICHRNTKILKTTVELLSEDAESDIYIHVDKKSNISDFNEYQNRVSFVTPRIDVQWGAYSQIECMLLLLDEARKREYDYFCIISGDDLPLKSSHEINKIFELNNGMEFIGIEKNYDRNTLEGKLKYCYSNLFYKKDKKMFERILIKLILLTNFRKRNKYYKSLPYLHKGSSWFCITKELSNYIFEYLENNEWYKEAFKKSYCGDEIFFQTLVMNSPFSNKIYHYDVENDDNRMALRYIDWVSGPEYPKVLNEEDFQKMKNTNCIFGRKFNENLDIDRYKKELSL